MRSKRFVYFTINQKNITNLLVNSMIGQLVDPPTIVEFCDTKDGQVITYRLKCTLKEEMMLRFSLSDYIMYVSSRDPVVSKEKIDWIWL